MRWGPVLLCSPPTREITPQCASAPQLCTPGKPIQHDGCFLESALPGTWVSMVKPAPLAPRKAVKISFKRVPVPRPEGYGVLVLDSGCQSNPRIPAECGATFYTQS